MIVAISPHYYYPSDHRWGFGGPLETLMQRAGVLDRVEQLNLERAASPGADLMPQYRPYLLHDKAILASPHKLHGPDGQSWRL